jgi:hypothetical protein
MDHVTSWFDGLRASAANLLDTMLGYLPNLIGALLLLLFGWMLARLVRAAAGRLGDAVNRLLDRFMRPSSLTRFRLSPRALKLIGNAAFWLVILFFITAATRVAQLDAFSSWLDRILAYLPNLLAGALIILAGYLVSALVRDLVGATLGSAGLAQSELFGAAAQGATFLTAVIIGIDQIGIDVTILITLIAIMVGAVLAGLSLAFGLGSRDFVSNLIGAHYLQQHLQPGQSARIGDIEGEVLELTPTSVVLATARGRTTIPAKVFNEAATVVMTPGDDHD